MADVEVVVLEDTVQKEEISRFHAPAIQHNPDGWGPCELPDQFKDIPYQPFSKGDRLGKVNKNNVILPRFGILIVYILISCCLILRYKSNYSRHADLFLLDI